MNEFVKRLDGVEAKINWIETRRLRDRAERFGIPTPPLRYQEITDEVGGLIPTNSLTDDDKRRIIEDIRKERRARMEDRMLWVNHLGPLISPLTGLVGVVLALLSFWHSCK